MKFTLNCATHCSRRLGRISDIHRLSELCLETPHFFLHSKGGSIPHVTYEVLQMIFKEPNGIQVPVTSTIHSEEAVREYKKGIAEFIGLKDNLIYCTVQDSAIGITSGFNDNSSVSVFTRKGRQQLDPERYMDIMEAFCPDMYQVLHDGDTDINSGKKRIIKAVDRTSDFTKACIARHKKSKVLQHKAILGVIEGGYNVNARKMCVEELKDHPFAGFVIDGLCKQGTMIENMKFNDIKEIIEETLVCLPVDKFRIIHGCWNPEVVVDLVDSGIDMFDGSYPFVVTERGSALTFCYQMNRNVFESEVQDNSENNSSLKKFEINLKDKRYFDDFLPISKTCSCLTCKEHTRSYIHHLLISKELLGSVLLMIHNLHHYFEFFKTIRCSIKKGQWEDFHKNFKEYCSKT